MMMEAATKEGFNEISDCREIAVFEQGVERAGNWIILNDTDIHVGIVTLVSLHLQVKVPGCPRWKHLSVIYQEYNSKSMVLFDG